MAEVAEMPHIFDGNAIGNVKVLGELGLVAG